MNIIVITNGRAQRRQIDLSTAAGLVPAVAVVAAVLMLSFGVGWALAAAHESAPDQQLASVETALSWQREGLQEVRRNLDQNMNALASRVGQLSAHVIRLDALGRRLTHMAELDDGEFDFDATPPRGGPELPSPPQAISIPDFAAELDALSYQLEDRRRQLEILESLLLSKNLEGQVHPDGFPVEEGWISSYYGKRTDPFTGRNAMHMGLDFAGRMGMEITAMAAGVVNFSGSRQGFGKIVEINHGNGFVTRYAHNSRNLVQVGEKVDKGQPIALMGSTGRATGPNLHFEVLQKGRSVNPMKYVSRGD